MESINFSRCPRCGTHAFESLSTHSYCVDCNYSPDLAARDDYAIPSWALDAVKEKLPQTKIPPKTSLKLALAS